MVQPMSVIHNEKEDKDVLVVYSLGNFISNMKTTDTRGGALVKVRVERDPDGKARFKNAAYDLLYSAKPTGVGSNFRVIPSRLATEHVPAAEHQKWLMFERSARRLFDDRNVSVPPIDNDLSEM